MSEKNENERLVVEEDDSDTQSSSMEGLDLLESSMVSTPAEPQFDKEVLLERRKKAELEEKRYNEIHERQVQLLQAIRDKESAADGEKVISPIDSLAQQAEVYTTFMHNAQEGQTPDPSKKEEKDGDRRRRASEADDEKLMNESDNAPSITRLLAQPKCITGGTMRSYQLEGLNWLIALYDTGISGILADEMGLGKTLQTISLLGYLYEVRAVDGPHIVIVPKSTLSNWRREFAKWCPCLRVVVLQGNRETRAEIIDTYIKPRAFNVLITSYEMVLREKAALSGVEWFYMVIDEAHRIKNEQSALSIVVRQLNTKYRLLVTGTPLQNNLHELWALLNFLMPSVFTSADVFDSYFKSSIQNDLVKRLHTVEIPTVL